MTTTEIRPFTIHIPQADLDDLRSRLSSTRWVRFPNVADDWSRGAPVSYIRELADSWCNRFDWRAHEARLNELPQFVTEIDGQRIHFVHARSSNPNATPLVLTHGWPSSFVEFRDVIAPLTEPQRFGGKASDAFHVIAPSLPGFGFSTPLAGGGWGNLYRVAMAWAELMKRLGYDRYVAHGGDVGGGVTLMLPIVDPQRVRAIHLTGPSPMPFGPPIAEDHLSTADAMRARRFNQFRDDGIGYLKLQATRPQTLGYSLNDSPVGQLAWIVEKFAEWTDPAKPLPDQAVDRDQLLTLVSVCWFTGSGASSAHFTYDGMKAFAELAGNDGANTGIVNPKGPPVGVSVFAADSSIRTILDPQNACASWREYDRGGHFPAMEVPETLVDELRAFFRGRL